MRGLYFQFLLVGLLFWGAMSEIAAQDRITFEAETNARQVTVGNYFQVNFVLKNANGQSFQPPRFEHFKVIGGPNRSMSTTIINGQMSRETSFAYSILAEKIGTFSIGAARITANGQEYRTNPLSIKVVKGAASSGKSRMNIDDIFVTAELSDTIAHVGQQVLLDYKIYTTKEIDSYNLINESEYQGLFSQEISRFDSRAFKEVINGKQYTTKILKRVALFPQQVGTIAMAPMRLRLGVVKPNQGRRRGFFMFKDVDYIQLNSNAVTLDVQSLPAPPEDFSGAVGQYVVQIEVPKINITTDDALSIKLSIRGNGDNKRLLPPQITLPGNFEVYDPKVVFEDVGENGGEIQHVKVFEYLSIPTTPGRYAIRPTFTYYNVDSSNYVTLQTEQYTISVGQGKGVKPQIGKETDKDITDQLAPIKEETKFYKKGEYFFGSWMFWVILLIPFLALGFAYMRRRKRYIEAGIDPKVLKYRKAYKFANKRLNEAKKHLENNESSAFYDEISKSTFGYLCDKLGIPLSDLNKANIREKMGQHQISETLSLRFFEVISRCEMALFAGMDNTGAMQETYEQAVQIIVDFEKEFEAK